MATLDDLRVFERVASLRSFAAASKALGEPRSNVSRSVARLETALGLRLFQRTTREVSLTAAGETLLQRCSSALEDLEEALTYAGSFATEAQGPLRISAGIGFGINVLADQLPAFLQQFPAVDVDLDLTSRVCDLVAERVDVAIRFGELPDSSLVAVHLGVMKRILCCAPDYLDRQPRPITVDDLDAHDLVEFPAADGQPRTWRLCKGDQARDVPIRPRVSVNDALTIHRLILNGAGIGIVSCYLCAPDLAEGRLVHLLPDWTTPDLNVHLVFPSRREMAPSVRAFVNHLKASNAPGTHWQHNVLPTDPPPDPIPIGPALAPPRRRRAPRR